MGFYGAFCLDCNHNCHPEMHPYEWTWWLNLKNEQSTDREWLIGLLHEGSNRFPKWSKNPITGEIKIPFVFSTAPAADTAMQQIHIQHLVFNKFEDEELKKLPVPATTISTKALQQTITCTDGGNKVAEVSVVFDRVLNTDGLKFWFSDLNHDTQNQIISLEN